MSDSIPAASKKIPHRAARSNPIRVEIGDHAVMRKAHPCGTSEWAVTRVGADIGLRCQGCGRRTMLAREAFERAVRRMLPRASEEGLWDPGDAGMKEDH